MAKYYFSFLLVLGFSGIYAVHHYLESQQVEDSFADDSSEDIGDSLGYGTLYPVLIDDETLESGDADYVSEREPAARRGFGRVTSGKGRRKRPKRGASSNHKGTDYAMACGTSVAARQSGRVTKAGWARGYGKTVAISTGGCRAIYAHLSSIRVRQGQQVGAGTVIGRSGKTGVSTGCHLHYESCSRLYAQLDERDGEAPAQDSTPSFAGIDIFETEE